MKAMARNFFALPIFIALFAFQAISQVPQKFNYQAVLRDAAGAVLANQSIAIKLSLTNSDGSDTYYSETQTKTSTAQGVITLVVGDGVLVSGDINAVQWSTGGIKLKIEVDPAGGSSFVLMGNETLLAVPYSQVAGNGFTAITNNGDGTFTYNFANGESYTTPNLIGPQGLKGDKGDTGDIGLTGSKGDTGDMGPQGEKGDKGDQGDVGPQGLKGDKGDQGDIGPQGATGSAGPQGPTGPQGLKGDKGDQGDVGSIGPQGSQGPIGPAGTGLINKGAWSADSTYLEGDYVFDDSSEDPLINSMWICQQIVGPVATQPKNDATSWVEFQAPQGEIGPQGPQGLQGLKGDKGDQGDIGPQGSQGPAGIEGKSIEWLGSLASAPITPVMNQAYYNTVDKASYIFNGSAWGILVLDGLQGPVGPEGPAGPEGPIVAGTEGQMLVYNGTNWTGSGVITVKSDTVGIGVNTPISRLIVQGESTALPEDPIFEVKNKDGKVVLGVYNEGVRVYVADGATKGAKGGFAVGGLTNQTKGEVEYFRITPDSARIYINDSALKGAKGGFAVGGLTNQTKGSSVEYLRITPDSARIYIKDTISTKGAKGGFAVGGLTNQTKGTTDNYLYIHRDSSRIYINDTEAKGAKGGFAVGGLTNQTKSGTYDLLRVTSDSTRVYVNENTGKGAKGGFAVGGLTNQTKQPSSQFLNLTPDNYFIGQDAGASINGGLYNSFMGFQSGFSSTTASNNLFLGYNSGYSNTTGNYNTIMGYEAGYNNNGNYNSLIGYYAGKSNTTGQYNTFMGHEAGLNYTTGSYNTFLGYQSGLASSTLKGTGKNNIAIGYKAGVSLTNGENNIFIGTEAGAATTGIVLVDTIRGENTFIGKWAGRFNTTGYQNIAVGYYAGKGLTSNSRNTLVGNNAGQDLISGEGNAFYGTYAGRLSTTAGNNTFVGYDCGYQCYTGTNNTFVGFQAGRGWGAVEMGDSSVFIGSEAGANESGSNKLYISNSITSTPLIWGDFYKKYATIHGKLGIYTKTPLYTVEGWGTNASLIAHYSGQSRGGISALSGTRVAMLSTASSDDLVFGYTSDADQLDFSTAFVERMRIDNGTGNVGIGTTAPAYKLDITGNARTTLSTYLATTAGNNVGIGTTSPTQKLHVKGSSATNAQILLEAGEWNSTGDYTQVTLGDGNHYIRGEYAGGLTFYTPDASGFLFGGGGNVRIGTTLNYAPLNVEKWEGLVAMFNRRNTTGQIIQFRYTDTEVGSISYNGSSTTYNTTSDARLKENIINTSFGILDLMKVNVRDFNFINDPNKLKMTGFIAQELYKVFPDAVAKPSNEDGIWQVDYGKLTPLVVKAVQDQELKIQKLEEQNALLRAELEEIKKMLKK